MLNIYVIENNKARHEQLVLLLRDLYKKATVLPTHSTPCRTWKQAQALVHGSRSIGELICIVDLALDGDDPTDAKIGISNSKRIRLLRPHAILIAATSHVPQLDSEEDAQGLFDAVLDKENLAWSREKLLRNLLYETIEDIRTKRSGSQTPVGTAAEYRDSLGIRLLEAVIGKAAFDKLISETTKGWSDIYVEALSTGFSGSHLIKVTGRKERHPVGLVLKVATKKDILDDEAKALAKYAEYLDYFAGCINTALGEVKQLEQASVFYLIQASLPGKTLYELLQHESSGKASRAIRSLLKLLIAQYAHAATQGGNQEPTAEKCFAFRPDQPYRIHDSCNDLEAMSKTLAAHRGWPTDVQSPRTVFESIRAMTDEWLQHLVKIEVPFWALQHGDLHAGNVLVVENQLRFIDLARLGPWPVGYDISRLATQARMFVTDHKDHGDWVINGLAHWVHDEFASIGTASSSQLCQWAILCDAAYHKFVQGRPSSQRRPLQRIYELGTLSNLLRMLSYQNISSFKRIWTGIACWRLGQRLGFIR